MIAIANALPAVVGDLLALPGQARTSVRVACGCEPRAYACVSCAQLLANRYQVALHTETGTNVIAQICDEHGAVALEAVS